MLEVFQRGVVGASDVLEALVRGGRPRARARRKVMLEFQLWHTMEPEEPWMILIQFWPE